MQKYTTTGVNVTYQEVLSKGVRGGDMFGRKRSSIPGGRGGGDSYMIQTGMLVVSLRGVNFGFWYRLGCSGQSANILSRQGLV